MLQRTKLKIYFLIVVHLQGATETTAKKLLQLLVHKITDETTTIMQGATENTATELTATSSTQKTQ